MPKAVRWGKYHVLQGERGVENPSFSYHMDFRDHRSREEEWPRWRG
jgi:hypothetical protein